MAEARTRAEDPTKAKPEVFEEQMGTSGALGWIEMYKDGATLQEVADVEGVTREAIRQRLRREGIPARSARETRRLQMQRLVVMHGRAVSDAFLRLRSIEHVSGELQLDPGLVKMCVRATVPDHHVLMRSPRTSTKRFATEELLEFLRVAAAGSGEPLTGDAFEKRVRTAWPEEETRRPPTKQVYAIRFGSWREALQAAGLPANPTTQVPKLFDRPEVGVEAIVACWLSIGSPPTVQEYEEWRPGEHGFPSSATLRAMLPDGSWNAGLLKAWQIVHGITLDQGDTDSEVPRELAMQIGYADYVRADDQVSLTEVPAGASDYNALERAVRSHAQLQNAVATEVAKRGLKPLSPGKSPPMFDLGFQVGSTFVVVEVKSATVANMDLQLRIGLGQVLWYAHELSIRHEAVAPALVLEREPSEAWKSLLYRLKVHVAWASDLTGGVAAIVEGVEIAEALLHAAAQE